MHWTLGLAPSVAVAAQAKKASSKVKRHIDGEGFVARLEQLDALINGAKPAKKSAKVKAPTAGVPGKMPCNQKRARVTTKE